MLDVPVAERALVRVGRKSGEREGEKDGRKESEHRCKSSSERVSCGKLGISVAEQTLGIVYVVKGETGVRRERQTERKSRRGMLKREQEEAERENRVGLSGTRRGHY